MSRGLKGRVGTWRLNNAFNSSPNGNSGEGADATKGSGARRSGSQLAGSDSWGQSRCPSHVEMVPRRAVRRVGPRPDLTRSTHIGEPSDPTGLLGDGSRSLCLPYRGRISPQVAVERRTKGASPRLRVANVSEPPGAPIEPSRGLRVSGRVPTPSAVRDPTLSSTPPRSAWR